MCQMLPSKHFDVNDVGSTPKAKSQEPRAKSQKPKAKGQVLTAVFRNFLPLQDVNNLIHGKQDSEYFSVPVKNCEFLPSLKQEEHPHPCRP